MLKRYNDIVNENLFDLFKKREKLGKDNKVGEFVVPTKNGDKQYQILDIKKVEIVKKGKIIDTVSIISGTDTSTSQGNVYQTRMRGDNYVRLYIRTEIVNVQVSKFAEIIKIEGSRKSTDIEWYQTLGFSYKNDSFKFDKVEKNHFTHHSGFDINKYEFDRDSPITDKEKINYIKGAISFREALKGKDFLVEDIVYDKDRRKAFFDGIEDLEAGIKSIISFTPVSRKEGAKQGTADIVLLDQNYRNYSFENKIVLVDPKTSICYLVDSNLIIDNSKGAKAQKNMDKLVETAREFDIDEYEKISTNIINNLPKKGKDIPKFVLVSLKKSRTGAQFGKATKIFKYHFPDEPVKENVMMYESWLGDMVDKASSFLTKTFNGIRKYFGDLYEQFVDTSIEVEYERNEKIVDELNKYISLGVMKSDYITESTEPESTAKPKAVKKPKVDKKALQDKINAAYIPKDFITEYVDNSLFIFSRERVVSSLSEKQKALKDYASDKVDKSITALRNNYQTLMDKKDIKSFHKKMVNVVSTAIMGGTNLPIYMVYEYDKSGTTPFSLHKIKPIKEVSQLKNINEMLSGDDSKPVYIVEVINNNDKDGKLVYRTMNIFIYNYSKSGDGDDRTHYYFKIRFGTNSSSRNTFMAETSPPSKGDIERIMGAFNSFKGQ